MCLIIILSRLLRQNQCDKDIGWSSAIVGRLSEIFADLPKTLKNLWKSSGDLLNSSISSGHLRKSSEDFGSSSEIVESLPVNFWIFGDPRVIFGCPRRTKRHEKCLLCKPCNQISAISATWVINCPCSKKPFIKKNCFLFLPDNVDNDKLFESDIKLTHNDLERVDTSRTGKDTPGAEVEVESIQGQRRKSIRSRRKIWPSRFIPVTATVDVGERDFLTHVIWKGVYCRILDPRGLLFVSLRTVTKILSCFFFSVIK